MRPTSNAVGVLFSAGLDSAVLLADALARADETASEASTPKAQLPTANGSTPNQSTPNSQFPTPNRSTANSQLSTHNRSSPNSQFPTSDRSTPNLQLPTPKPHAAAPDDQLSTPNPSTARTHLTRVQPIYVSAGLAWEREERKAAERLLASPPFAGRALPLVALEFDMRDVYPPTHWAVRGEAPAYDSPDADVYIEGRNIVLLSKASIFAARARLGRILIGPLAGNPFPDATAEFFRAMANALSLGLATSIAIEAPFATMHKADVIRLGRLRGVLLELTLSCMQPREGVHCGQCSKCRERIEAFHAAAGEDPTSYATARG